jgi:DNA-binding transcriptional ArsR family regulator
MQVTFAALADASRLRIIELLRGGPQPVSAIADALELRQPQVSKHLRVLKDAGLVDVEAQAQLRLYRLSTQPLRELQAWLDFIGGEVSPPTPQETRLGDKPQSGLLFEAR